jgi:hypothetical protein
MYRYPSFEPAGRLITPNWFLSYVRVTVALAIFPYILTKTLLKFFQIFLLQFSFPSILIIFTGFGQTIHDVAALKAFKSQPLLVIIIGSRLRHNPYVKYLWAADSVINIWTDIKLPILKLPYLQTFGRFSPFKITKILNYILFKNKSKLIINQTELKEHLFENKSNIFDFKKSTALDKIFISDIGPRTGKYIAENTVLFKFYEIYLLNNTQILSKKLLKKFNKIKLNFDTQKILLFYSRHRTPGDPRNLRNTKEYDQFLLELSSKYTIVICGDGQNYFKQTSVNSKNFIFLNNLPWDENLLYIYFSSVCELFIGTPGGGAWLPQFFKKQSLIFNHRPLGLPLPACSFTPMHYWGNNGDELMFSEVIRSYLYAEDFHKVVRMSELSAEEMLRAFDLFLANTDTRNKVFSPEILLNTAWGYLKSPRLIT